VARAVAFTRRPLDSGNLVGWTELATYKRREHFIYTDSIRDLFNRLLRLSEDMIYYEKNNDNRRILSSIFFTLRMP